MHARHPRFRAAVRADLLVALRQRGDERTLDSPARVAIEALRLAWLSDAFGALVLYRLEAACQQRRIPVVPRLAHRVAMVLAQVSIGAQVLVHPGVIMPHGQVAIDGIVEIGPGVRLRPFVTIGPNPGSTTGPTIQEGASIGTGATILGPISVGARAQIGANAVVATDVPAGATVTGLAE